MHKHDVVDIERELDPRSAIWNNPGGKKLLAVGMDFLIEKDARRTVQLADNYAFGAIDDEGAVFGQ